MVELFSCIQSQNLENSRL